MRKSELEAWVLNVIDRVALGQPNEDARVELKSEWPKPAKAARRIAGHANAAGGEPILWIIGVDQSAGVVGVSDLDVASWVTQVKAEFDELAPDLSLDLNIPVGGGKTVVALLFETDRAPFVVKNPAFGSAGGGPVQLEVPWREGTSIRSSTRSDLLRLLSPLELLPSFEVIEGELKMRLPGEEGSRRPTWWVLLKLYIVPKEVPVVIPYHRCRGKVRVDKFGIEAPLSRVLLYPANKVFGRIGRRRRASSPTILESNDELIIDGPGMLKIEASSPSDDSIDVLPLDAARVTVEMFTADAERPSIVSADFQYLSLKDDEHVWFLIGGNLKP
jgi:hypothetical protein